MRLIDADRAIKYYKALANIRHNEICSPFSWAHAFNEFILYLEQTPAVDAVEVVRCRDCKHYYDYGVNRDYCCHRSKWGKQVFDVKFKADDFCSYGKRKDCDD